MKRHPNKSLAPIPSKAPETLKKSSLIFESVCPWSWAPKKVKSVTEIFKKRILILKIIILILKNLRGPTKSEKMIAIVGLQKVKSTIGKEVGINFDF